VLPALSDNSLKADHEAGIDPHRGTGSVVAGAIVDVERAVEADERMSSGRQTDRR